MVWYTSYPIHTSSLVLLSFSSIHIALTRRSILLGTWQASHITIIELSFYRRNYHFIIRLDDLRSDISTRSDKRWLIVRMGGQNNEKCGKVDERIVKVVDITLAFYVLNCGFSFIVLSISHSPPILQVKKFTHSYLYLDKMCCTICWFYIFVGIKRPLICVKCAAL